MARKCAGVVDLLNASEHHRCISGGPLGKIIVPNARVYTCQAGSMDPSEELEVVIFAEADQSTSRETRPGCLDAKRIYT